ncbi:MAG TPA: hypothetical protein GXZ79_02890 [Acholeplasma sp.]|nr:hypothetical protein [Acholeplasma sp.]
MESCNDEDKNDALLECISDWKADLESIGVGKWSKLEELRSANAALRDWGNEMYNDAESLESERDDFERKYEEEKEKVSKLEDEVEELRSEISELKRTAGWRSLIMSSVSLPLQFTSTL